MNRRWMGAAVATWLLLAAPVGAQEDDAVAAERDPALSKWPWFMDATPQPAPAAALHP